MNTLTLTPRPDLKLLAIEVPEDAYQFTYYPLDNKVDYWRRKHPSTFGYFTCPPGKYSIVGLLRDVTEEQAGELVEDFSPGNVDSEGVEYRWLNYYYRNSKDYEKWGDCFPYSTALESLHSLIRSAGGKETDNLLILKQEV